MENEKKITCSKAEYCVRNNQVLQTVTATATSRLINYACYVIYNSCLKLEQVHS